MLSVFILKSEIDLLNRFTLLFEIMPSVRLELMTRIVISNRGVLFQNKVLNSHLKFIYAIDFWSEE